MSNSIDQPYINNVELHRPTLPQQCRTPSTNRMSTMSNSIDQPYLNNVELHRPTVYQQCRTPSTNRVSTMSNSIDKVVSPSQWCPHQQCRTPSTNLTSTVSNSIDQPYINNVELHRPTISQQCRTPSTNRISTMSNSIGSRTVCQVQQCRTLSTKSYHRHNGASINNVEVRHGELSSCAKQTLNTCNLLSTRPRAASDSKKK